MVVKPKFILNSLVLIAILGFSPLFFAQTKMADQRPNLSEDKTLKSDGEFDPIKIESQKKANSLMDKSVAKLTTPKDPSVTGLNQFSGIPSAFISLGNRQPTYGIVVEKKIHRLTVFKLQEDGNYSAIKSYKAITGKEMGDKKFSGDNRTPEGIYFVVGQKKAEELESRWGKSANKYGPKAFVLDYPNIFDRRLHKTGFGIWIHGVDKETRILKPFDTEGCVALKNKDVLDVSNYISSWETPVVIVDEMQSAPLHEIQDRREKVLNMLESWRKAWESSTLNNYTGYYSDDFYSLGKTKEQWQNYKKTLAKLRDKSIEVQISEPKILAFRNQLLVEFMQKYSAKGKIDFGRKFLYLRQEGNDFKIIAEKWYPIKNHLDVELAVVQNNRATTERQAKN